MSLYEIAQCVRFVIASSSYHPNLSLTSSKSFGKFPENPTSNNMKTYVKNFITKYQCLTKKEKCAKYTCLASFDLKNINVVNYIKILNFKNQKRLPYDKYRYDLSSGIIDPHLKKKFKN